MAKKKIIKEKKDIAEIVDTVHKRHLEQIRKENIKARSKRKRKVSDSSLDEIIKKVADEAVYENLNDPPNEDVNGVKDYLKWKTSEYDTYNSINRRSVINSIDILEKAISDKKQYPKKRWCISSDSVKSTEILWATSSYIIRSTLRYKNGFAVKYGSRHCFPNPAKNMDMFKKWIKYCDNEIRSLPPENVYQNRRVCRNHFTNDQFASNNRLLSTAYSVLNIPSKLSA
ncbi:thap domain [Holotrichia oblita]|uniref:Thap domain n=1 Tax=Holotrichia oblita TaxID=644536 RepID=A0ACB9TMC4_HOLOL|nr:thap domain [Holotrichia oblita]